jgi:hypothetical protein
MAIVTHLDTTGYAPVDERWCAYEDSTFDGPGSLIGKGATEDAAIADLEQQEEDADEAAALAADAACDVCNGTGWLTVRSTFPCAYVCAGEPPEDAKGVTGWPCSDCHSFHRAKGRS